MALMDNTHPKTPPAPMVEEALAGLSWGWDSVPPLNRKHTFCLLCSVPLNQSQGFFEGRVNQRLGIIALPLPQALLKYEGQSVSHYSGFQK
jgi:hypothetical protein